MSNLARLLPNDIALPPPTCICRMKNTHTPISSSIVQVELPRRQALLEAETTVERLEGLVALLEREVLLLSRRLRHFTPDPRLLGGVRRS